MSAAGTVKGREGEVVDVGWSTCQVPRLAAYRRETRCTTAWTTTLITTGAAQALLG